MPPSTPDRAVSAARRKIHYTARVIKNIAQAGIDIPRLSVFLLLYFYSSSRNTRDFSRGIRGQKSSTETRFIVGTIPR